MEDVFTDYIAIGQRDKNLPRQMRIVEKQLKTAPAVEPVSVAEVKGFLKLNSGPFAGNISSTQTIAPASYGITPAYGIVGASVDVLVSKAVVEVVSGTNGAGGTLDIKLQHSDDNTTWADVTGGAFTQITTANDNATYKLAYAGNKQYVRAVATVAVAACVFSVNVLEDSGLAADDDLLAILITNARRIIETITGRALITQTWYCYPENFPQADTQAWELPIPPLASVTAITYYDEVGDTANVIPSAQYAVDLTGNRGRIFIKYNYSWPVTTLRRYTPIVIEFVCGYGATVDTVPAGIRTALLQLVTYWYENRAVAEIQGNAQAAGQIPQAVLVALEPFKLVRL